MFYNKFIFYLSNTNEHRMASISTSISNTNLRNNVIFFDIVIFVNGQRYKNVSKRYSELFSIHQDIVKNKKIKLPDFPQKIYYMTKSSLQKRMSDLEEYLNKICNDKEVFSYFFPEIKENLFEPVEKNVVVVKPVQSCFYRKRSKSNEIKVEDDEFVMQDRMLEELYNTVVNTKKASNDIDKELRMHNNILDNTNIIARNNIAIMNMTEKYIMDKIKKLD